MNKILTILILVAGIYCGYHLYLYWGKVKVGEDLVKQETPAEEIHPENLPGMPERLAGSYQVAQRQGPATLARWLTAYCNQVQDPRRAWIELDYCAMIARDDPAEARRIFALVKDRTPPSSPLWPRIQKLEKSYE